MPLLVASGGARTLPSQPTLFVVGLAQQGTPAGKA